MPDILFILLLALVIFGPRKLPELASHAGRYLAQFQRMKRELRAEIEAEVGKLTFTEEGQKSTSSAERSQSS